MEALLHLPLDFERLPEFRMLVRALQANSKLQTSNSKLMEGMATFLFLRLFVELALLGRSTNRPGYLTSPDLFEATVDDLFGEGAEPIRLLVESGVLMELGEELFCQVFARHNEHFSGDYVKREVRGANASAVVRNQKHINQAAMQQSMLLPEEVFRKADGSNMDSAEVRRAMVMILNLDRALKAPPRKRLEYTAGLIADACAAAATVSEEEATAIYTYLSNHRDKPGVPGSAEGILRDWATIRNTALGNL